MDGREDGCVWLASMVGTQCLAIKAREGCGCVGAGLWLHSALPVGAQSCADRDFLRLKTSNLLCLFRLNSKGVEEWGGKGSATLKMASPTRYVSLKMAAPVPTLPLSRWPLPLCQIKHS